ncbi:phosphoglucosamine mutase [Thiohalomonas denitrificans]|uniref:Phosphoglucosamine mutase n=1 Tax=Thiohalomonas denitrificans TaxID=415747 RepID=A0A1G5PJ63_9GAMM|nr:phosphoglucosamine mutase [Thiohalomonas denitrificans]SCZ49478.1 phosphoglucosamine mutase [Thiohalomonas denitrificans]
MGRKYFGTDGIRGRVGEFPITPEFVLKLGWAAGQVLSNGEKGKVLIGKDTRISGYMFESALEAGLSSAGLDILLLGPMPTPAVAYLTRTLRASAGIVISASHNPFQDNGIKFFSTEGSKLPDEVELAIEERLEQPMSTVQSSALGKAVRVDDAPGRYIEFCKSTFPRHLSLKGLHLVVDCSNGATYHVAPSVFRELGARVDTIGADPDGLNINVECGSTEPEQLSLAVIERGADAGIALDGDGDRVIMVDHKGDVVDGDELLFIIAREQHRQEAVAGVVGTLMSNLGMERALKAANIDFQRVKVGDRYVLERLRQNGWLYGGESSGHLLCLNHATTGDGIVSALQVLAAIAQTGRPLNELKAGMTKYPQVMINVRTTAGFDLEECAEVQDAVRAAEAELNGTGRVLLRPSGTEPLVRVMVEGEELELVECVARGLADAVEAAIAVTNNQDAHPIDLSGSSR